ncbi:hypothetical protein [Fuerstiella marisgermanici]|uniref:hypothetical protein n=1 Tax=Fuerstiella marisgermanici TaxID=1891926 RepID=UPI00097CBBB3|nr:hypothetical protein [Fuerstiella marisgermanici]
MASFYGIVITSHGHSHAQCQQQHGWRFHVLGHEVSQPVEICGMQRLRQKLTREMKKRGAA